MNKHKKYIFLAIILFLISVIILISIAIWFAHTLKPMEDDRLKSEGAIEYLEGELSK